METKNSESEFLWRNTSNNLSQAANSTSREYVFAPVSYRIKLILFIVMLSFGTYGLIANSLVLYFKHKKHRRRCHGIQRPIRRSLAEYFIRSLCLSDILCSLISTPLYSSEMFVHFVTKDRICRFSRFFTTVFPVVTILNLLVIGIERYLAIFHPFFVINRRKAKKMVVGAWVVGVLITLISVVFFGLVKHDIGDNSYTLACGYDNSVSLYRASFTAFIFLSYIAPSFILTFINLRIIKRQRDSRVDAARTTQRTVSRLKVTRMFVSLIFAFIIPYMGFVLYYSFRTASSKHVSFADDYIARRINTLLAYANGSVSGTLLIYYEKLYIVCFSCFRSNSTRNIGSNEPPQRQAPAPVKKEENRGVHPSKSTIFNIDVIYFGDIHVKCSICKSNDQSNYLI